MDELGLGRPAAILTLLAGVVIAHRILRPVSDTPRVWDAAEGESSETLLQSTR